MAKNSRIRVAILFGGRSAEHEVSVRSARNVINAIDSNRYEAVLIGIDREGGWYLNDDSSKLLNPDQSGRVELDEHNRPVSLIPGDRSGVLVDTRGPAVIPPVDVLFPILHGPYGEDGSVQGLARLANVPCVGSGILGSAVGMDKDICKRLLRDAGILVARHLCVRANDVAPGLARQVDEKIGYPAFVKPANMGSSVGVVRADNAEELLPAVETALQYDNKILIEETIRGREIECSVLGNDQPQASTVGEILTSDGFYSYEKKYIDETGAVLKIPAELDETTLENARSTSIRVFQALEARGFARVDMFVTADGEIYVNEINTIPGFTEISMYPKLWEASGISYADLIDRLIQLALEDHAAQSRLKTTGY